DSPRVESPTVGCGGWSRRSSPRRRRGPLAKRIFRLPQKRKTSGTSRLFNAMREHTDHAIWSIHALLSDIQTRPELDAYERDFIAFLRSQDPEYGYNICRGGEGFTGPHTEQWKEKMRVRMKGRTFTPEAIARMKASPKTEVQ